MVATFLRHPLERPHRWRKEGSLPVPDWRLPTGRFTFSFVQPDRFPDRHDAFETVLSGRFDEPDWVLRSRRLLAHRVGHGVG